MGKIKFSIDGKRLIKVVDKNATHIFIPNSVTEIGFGAFSGCSYLDSIDIPNSVTEIGSMAFRWCTSLKCLVIPNSVIKIDSGAFKGCTSLESIDIPNSVTEIGRGAFEGCTFLENINIINPNIIIGSKAFVNTRWYEKQPDGVIYINNALYKYKGDLKINTLVLKNGTTIICESAFEGYTSLESIDIPNTVTEIGSSAFSGCTSLESIDIPNSVTKIGWGAFKKCTSLKSVDIPNSVTKIGGSAFSSCTSLESIDIPNSVTEIGDSAFSNCISLVNIDIPNSVIEIGGRAFMNCTSVKSVDIPNSVTEIGSSVFEGCTSLKKIDIPESVREIGEFAFNRSSLEVLNINSKIIEIGEHAICNCPICSITVDKDNPDFISKDDVLYKKWEGDKNSLVKYAPKKEGKRFCIEENTVKLDSCAFKHAKELEEIVLHEGVLSLGEEQTFAYCTSLKQILIPSNIRKIPKKAFSGCSSLNVLTLPNSSYYTIEESAFEQCILLHSIHSLVENVDNIVINEKAFDGFDIDKCVLYVPSGTRWAYRHHPGFGRFKNIETEKKREQGSQGDNNIHISKLFNEIPMEDIIVTKLRANVERYSKIKEGITKTLYLEDGENVVFDSFDWSKGTENAFIYLNDGKRKIWYSFLRQMYFTKEMEIVYPTIRFYDDSTDTTINTFTGKEFETAVNKRTFKVEIDKRAIYTFNRKCPKFIDMEYNQDRAYQYIMQLLNEKNLKRLGSLLKMGQCYHLYELSSV